MSRRDRWALLGGQPVVHADRRRPPFWVWNGGLRQLYLSAYHVSPANAASMLDAMRRHRVRFLLGYPSGMHALAQAALELGLEGPRLDVVLSNAEPLYDHQRESLGRVFGCPVRDSYGMTEIVAAGSECEHGTHHRWPEVGHIEYESGRLVCTGLFHSDMPLVRYEVGDRGRPAEQDAPCPCGRALPRLGPVEGRLDDVVVTPDGRRVGRLHPIFKADLPIREAQVVQDRIDRIRVRIVPAGSFSERNARVLERRFRERLGEMDYRFELVDSIPRGPNGKFRAVVSRIEEPQGAHPPA